MNIYTVAQDFWQSKTTHLAIVAAITAVWGHLTHQFPLVAQIAMVLGPTAIAFLRDAHVKSHNEIADLLDELIQSQSDGSKVKVDLPIVLPDQPVP